MVTAVRNTALGTRAQASSRRQWGTEEPGVLSRAVLQSHTGLSDYTTAATLENAEE